MGEAAKIIDNVIEDLKAGYTLSQLEEKYGVGVLDIFTHIAKIIGGLQGIVDTVEALQRGESNILETIAEENRQVQEMPELTSEEKLIYAAPAREAVSEDFQTHSVEAPVIEEPQGGYEEEHHKTLVLTPNTPVAAPTYQEAAPVVESNPSKVDWGSASLVTPGGNVDENSKML